MKKRITALLAALVMTAAPITPVSALSDPITREKVTEPSVSSGKSGMYLINGRVYEYVNGTPKAVTGTVQLSSGTGYCIDGAPWFGWIKLAGSWYYFSPDNGVMQTGTVRTGAGSYRMNSDGTWSGTLSKSAKMPSDFSLEYTVYDGSRTVTLSTASKKLTVTPDGGKASTTSLALNAKDRQMIYDTIISCSVDKIDYAYLYAQPGREKYTIRMKMNSRTVTVYADSAMYDHYDDSEDIQGIAYFNAFITNYLSAVAGFESSSEVSDKSSGNTISPVTSVLKKVTVANKRYKSTRFGLDSSALNSGIVLTSVSDTRKLIKNIVLSHSSKKFSYVSRLLSYDDEFFKTHHVIYTEAVLPSSKFSSYTPKYDVTNNRYTLTFRTTSSGGSMYQYITLSEVVIPAEAAGKKPTAAVNIT